MAEFLLEIGFEEMPAPWLSGLGEQARALFEKLAAEQHLEPSSVQSFFTPRRLVVAAQVAARQADREERVWGPSLKVAKGGDGAWTNAANGFAKKVGSTPGALEVLAKDPGVPDDVYLSFVKKTPGRASSEVLPAVVAGVLRGLAFPKRMSWDAWLEDGKGAFPFGRPIRWLVALLDGAIVPFTVFELVAGAKGPAIVESGKLTHGHRFLPRASQVRSAPVGSLQELGEGLRKLFVLLDPAEREARVGEQLAKHNGGPVADDHGLAAEWRDLVEYPTVLAGSVPAEFRALPTEVLETVLVHHQKYVPLLKGGQVERFAAVTNGDGGNADAVVRNMERVVVARLRDAAFFWAEDRKQKLDEQWLGKLAGVVFHRDLGTYQDKAGRLEALVAWMSGEGLLPSVHGEAAAHKAARMCKADLVTLMVREFPELQGVMGGLYLRAADEPEDVVRAVYWHYHPVSVEEGSTPAGALEGQDTTAFAAVSLADKLDTLAGYFGLGLVPTGSSDPFGLRRAAQGLVRVLLDFWPQGSPRPSLRRLVAQAIHGFAVAGKLKRTAAEAQHDLEGFLLDRLRYVLVARGFPADETDAVLAARDPDALDDPHETLLRLRALHHVRREASDDFAH
ncbi:MAG TPA: glycine--tRNA ligase subunit beta, partial [Vicinamibacteria bacterium]|nr:glycine--tRNA ligase subunit beta [Vicinamibacteria bacterium]